VDPKKHALDGSARWHHLTNTTGLSMCGGDAAFCQITLTTCYYYVYNHGGILPIAARPPIKFKC